MLDLRDLSRPVIAAPMAGGPTTPALVTAAVEAGGAGQLAAGYLAPDALAVKIAEVRDAGVETFGVNVFVPEQRGPDVAAVTAYRDALSEYASSLGVELPEPSPALDEDHFTAKVELLADLAVPMVSFTFGCPDAAVLAMLHERGTSIGVTVTTVEEAQQSVAAGADWLCAQGPEAGGHRSTFDRDVAPPTASLEELLAAVVGQVDVPVVAAGGISTRERADALRSMGAVAVQVGTALLRTPEAGTKPAHAAALADPARERTLVTRAFSGRSARALANAFTDRFDAEAVAEYPAVNALTGGVRKASADDADGLNLWAGTAWRDAREEPAAAVIERLG